MNIISGIGWVFSLLLLASLASAQTGHESIRTIKLLDSTTPHAGCVNPFSNDVNLITGICNSITNTQDTVYAVPPGKTMYVTGLSSYGSSAAAPSTNLCEFVVSFLRSETGNFTEMPGVLLAIDINGSFVTKTQALTNRYIQIGGKNGFKLEGPAWLSLRTFHSGIGASCSSMPTSSGYRVGLHYYMLNSNISPNLPPGRAHKHILAIGDSSFLGEQTGAVDDSPTWQNAAEDVLGGDYVISRRGCTGSVTNDWLGDAGTSTCSTTTYGGTIYNERLKPQINTETAIVSILLGGVDITAAWTADQYQNNLEILVALIHTDCVNCPILLNKPQETTALTGGQLTILADYWTRIDLIVKNNNFVYAGADLQAALGRTSNLNPTVAESVLMGTAVGQAILDAGL